MTYALPDEIGTGYSILCSRLALRARKRLPVRGELDTTLGRAVFAIYQTPCLVSNL